MHRVEQMLASKRIELLNSLAHSSIVERSRALDQARGRELMVEFKEKGRRRLGGRRAPMDIVAPSPQMQLRGRTPSSTNVLNLDIIQIQCLASLALKEHVSGTMHTYRFSRLSDHALKFVACALQQFPARDSITRRSLEHAVTYSFLTNILTI
jgi:hypothetical protein